MCLSSIFFQLFSNSALAYITSSFLQIVKKYFLVPVHVCLLSVGAFSFLWQTFFSFSGYFLLLPYSFCSGMTRPTSRTQDVGAPWSWLQKLLVPPCLLLTYFKICILFQSVSKPKFLFTGPNLLIRAKLWDNYSVETSVTVQ